MKDCLSCGHSFSTEENELHCMLWDVKVNEEDVCEEHN